MERYEQETGKQAIWQGKVTKGFLKWKEGEKGYYADKKRISVYVSGETEKRWHDFINTHDLTSFSKLIRESVNFYIKEKSGIGGKIFAKLNMGNESKLAHVLKERLTTIKGFLQLLLEKYKEEFNDDAISIINSVVNESKKLENAFLGKLEKGKIALTPYDVLLIEDDPITIDLLQNYFESKGCSFKGVLTGLKGIEELSMNIPKLILLDVILPDISGFDICKDLKNHEKLKNIPVYYITAVPGNKVKEKMIETKADGYILKPFDLPELKFLLDFL